MKKIATFHLIILLLSPTIIFAQDEEFDDEEAIIEKVQNPRTFYLNAAFEPVVFAQFDEQFVLGSGLRFSAYHFINRVSFEGGIERQYFNFESAYTKERSPYLTEPNFNPLLGTNYFATLSYSLIHKANDLIYKRKEIIERISIHQFLDLRIGYGSTNLSTNLNVNTLNLLIFNSGQLYFLQNLQHLKFALNYKWLYDAKLETPYGTKNLKKASQEIFFEVWYLLNDPFPTNVQFNTQFFWWPLNTDFIEVPSNTLAEMKNSVSKFPLGFFMGSKLFGLKTHSLSLTALFGVVPGYHNESFNRIYFSTTVGYNLSYMSKKYK
jgi:hypothetical protein